MWIIAGRLCSQDPPAKEAQPLLSLLMDAQATQNRRVAAFLSRVPDPVIWLLLAAAVTAMATVAIFAGLCKHRSLLARVLLAILICATIYILLDLDQPRRGLIQIDQGPMLRVKQIVQEDTEATG